MNKHRLLAVAGLVLIVVSLVCMMAGFFAPAARALLLNISLVCFLGAAAILLGLSALRKRDEQSKSDEE